MGFFSSIRDVFVDSVSAVGSAFGIEELDINQQIEDAENEARQQIKEERELLHAQLNSANAKERIAAEEKLTALESDNKKQMRKLQRDAIATNREMDAKFKAKQASLTSQEKPTEVQFDRKGMLDLRRRAINRPTIGPRPGQGEVMPRPTTTSGSRSGQSGTRRPS